MKSPSLFLKTLVLTGFVSSIVGLVAYRTGHLDGLLYGTSNASPRLSMDGTQPFPVDTPPPETFMIPSTKSGKPFLPVMSSSKSIIVDDGRRPTWRDSVINKNLPLTRKDTPVKVSAFYLDEAMSSSKSFIVYTPDTPVHPSDSARKKENVAIKALRTDTLRFIDPIYSSKSGRIVEPQKPRKSAKKAK